MLVALAHGVAWISSMLCNEVHGVIASIYYTVLHARNARIVGYAVLGTFLKLMYLSITDALVLQFQLYT